MSRPKNKDEYRAQLAEAFTHVLEEHGLEWRKEWHGSGGMAPHNAITKACYRGSNAFWLSLIAMMKGYNDPRWATMVQIMDKDGKYHPKEKWHLKAGSKATYVEYWYPYDLEKKKALRWEEYKRELRQGRPSSEFRLSTRYTAVFNACEIEGIPELVLQEKNNIAPDELIDKLSAEMGVEILTDGGDEAYYSPAQDKIHLPTPGSFETQYAFNATALHELAHSTGHETRLNRSLGGMFGSSEYAYEELVAEMCSCFMGVNLDATASKEHIDNHKAYVQSWIQKIRDKPETLTKAIKDAQAAANYMDWKAGLITDKEYAGHVESVIEVDDEKTPERAPDLNALIADASARAGQVACRATRDGIGGR